MTWAYDARCVQGPSPGSVIFRTIFPSGFDERARKALEQFRAVLRRDEREEEVANHGL